MKKFLFVLMCTIMILTLFQPLSAYAETSTSSAGEERKRAADEVIAELVAGWDKDASQFDRIYEIYKWICANVKYDASVTDKIYSDYDQLYFAVVEHRAICEGYALLFKRLCSELGIEAICIDGYLYTPKTQTWGLHEWNLVKLGDYWYHCDPTADRGRVMAFGYLLDVELANHYPYGAFATEEFWANHPLAETFYTIAHTCTYRTEKLEAACTEGAAEKEICRLCGEYTLTVTGNPLGHEIEKQEANDSTCIVQGNNEYFLCTRCNTPFADGLGEETIRKDSWLLPLEDHEYGEYIQTKAPSCTEKGKEEGKCTVCYDADSRELDMLPHTPVIIPGYDFTCTGTGLTAGEKCNVCGTIIKEQTVIAANCPGKGFSDLELTSWYHLDADYVVSHGLMKGVSDTSFAPDATTTRAMIVTILYRMSGETVTKEMREACRFTDVPEDSWYSDAVIWASYQGVVKGLSETSFAPDNAITREQMVTMLYRYADSVGYDFVGSSSLSSFPDGGSVSDWAKTRMEWAVGAGLINGTALNGQTYLQPRGQTTRIQAAAFIHRLCGMLE